MHADLNEPTMTDNDPGFGEIFGFGFFADVAVAFVETRHASSLRGACGLRPVSTTPYIGPLHMIMIPCT